MIKPLDEMRGSIWSIQEMDDNELYEDPPAIVLNAMTASFTKSKIISSQNGRQKFKSLGSFANESQF